MKKLYGFDEVDQIVEEWDDDELEQLFAYAMDASLPSKSFVQLLAENPNHKGGLAQLAAAEVEALSRESMRQTDPLQQHYSGTIH